MYRRGKCDFPWDYNDRSAWADSRFGGGATGSYPTIPDDIAIDLWAPWIDSIHHPKDAACFFWITWPKIEFCLEFIKASGFRISTLAFDWIKTCKNDETKPKPGIGSLTGSNSEMCIAGIRGSMPPVKKLVGQVVETYYQWQELREPVTVKHPHVYGPDGKIIHSRKPEIFKAKIDLMFPPEIYGQGIGLFERESQGPGWDVFGNEVEGSIPGPNFQQQKLRFGA